MNIEKHQSGKELKTWIYEVFHAHIAPLWFFGAVLNGHLFLGETKRTSTNLSGIWWALLHESLLFLCSVRHGSQRQGTWSEPDSIGVVDLRVLHCMGPRAGKSAKSFDSRPSDRFSWWTPSTICSLLLLLTAVVAITLMHDSLL